jgi:hypothetical protein
MRTCPALLAAAFVSAALPALAQGVAQPAPPREAPGRGSFEVSGGVLWQGGFDLGRQTAELTRNGDESAGPLALFTTDSEVDSIAGLRARLGYYLSPDVAIEGGLLYSRPVLSIRLADDFEDAPALTAEETIEQFLVDGAVVYYMNRLSFAGRKGLPFVTAGAGYLRELHEGRALVETGSVFHASAGVKYWFGSGWRVGVRGEAGLSSRDGGSDSNDGRRTLPVASVSIMYVF